MTKKFFIHCSICKEKVQLPHSHADDVKEPVERVDIDPFMEKLYNANGQMLRLVEQFTEEYKEEPLVIIEAFEKGLTQGTENMKDKYYERFTNAERVVIGSFSAAGLKLGKKDYTSPKMQQIAAIADSIMDIVHRELFGTERGY